MSPIEPKTIALLEEAVKALKIQALYAKLAYQQQVQLQAIVGENAQRFAALDGLERRLEAALAVLEERGPQIHRVR